MTTTSQRAGLPPRLVEARTLVYTELQRADTKATSMLTVAPLAVAAAALAVDTDDVTLPGVSVVGLWLAGLAMVAAVVLLLDVIRPRLGRQSRPGTWVHAARHGAGTLLDEAATADIIAADVTALARSAIRKHRRLAVAVWLIIVAVVTLAASLAIAAAH